MANADGTKQCSRCKATKPISEYHRNAGTVDKLQDECRPCRAATLTKYAQTNKGKAMYAAASAKYNASAHGKAVRVKYKRSENGKAMDANSKRRCWHRLGSGRHAGRVQDWTDYFQGLANDTERTIAAHVLLVFAEVDRATHGVVIDRWFDYNVLADLIEAEQCHFQRAG